MKFKKLLSGFLAATVAISSLALSAFAVSAADATGQCGDNVTWSFDKETGVLTISGTGPMYEENYSRNGSWTYSSVGSGKLKEVVVEEGVTSIGACAFSNGRDSVDNLYSVLTHVTLPSTIEKISNYAFKNLNVDITIPENVRYIGQNAFSNTPISSVNLASGTTVGTAAFGKCNSLKEVTIPAGLIYIKGDGGNRPAENLAFSDCTSLEKVKILGGGRDTNSSADNALSQGMFIGCTALKEVILDCKDLAYVYKATDANATFPKNSGMKFKVYKGSTTETTLRNAGYLTDDNAVYFIDFDALNTAIAEGESVDTSIYTDDSVKVLTDAVTAAKAFKENDTAQDDVDAAAKAITDAIAALTYKPADYSAIEEAKAKIPADLSGYTDETVSALNKALNAVVEGKNITEQETVDAYAKAIEDAITELELKPIGGTVTGTIKVSDENSESEITIKAVSVDGTETIVTATSMGTYTIENLEAGDYTLTVSGGKYAERSYEITVAEGENALDAELNPLGDINGDGQVTTADVGKANSHAKGVITLTDYDFACADVKNDGSITTADVGMINSHAKGVNTLW